MGFEGSAVLRAERWHRYPAVIVDRSPKNKLCVATVAQGVALLGRNTIHAHKPSVRRRAKPVPLRDFSIFADAARWISRAFTFGMPSPSPSSVESAERQRPGF
jgi:hypothetical protein